MTAILNVLSSWILVIEIGSTFGSGMPFIIRLIYYIRIRLWIRSNLPKNWKWKTTFILIEWGKFSLVGKIKDTEDLKPMFPGWEVKKSDMIFEKMCHRFGKPRKFKSLIDQIESADQTFDRKTYNRSKQLDVLLK